MRRFRLAMSITATALIASGCGGEPNAERSATKVLRPEEVKISLGAETKPAAESSSSTPAAATEGSAP